MSIESKRSLYFGREVCRLTVARQGLVTLDTSFVGGFADGEHQARVTCVLRSRRGISPMEQAPAAML